MTETNKHKEFKQQQNILSFPFYLGYQKLSYYILAISYIPKDKLHTLLSFYIK